MAHKTPDAEVYVSLFNVHVNAFNTHSASLFTPTNVVLFSLAVYFIYLRLRPSAPASLPPRPPATVYQKFTPETLKPHNGTDLPTVYLAVKGKVYDCTPGKTFYGPGGPYANFAGHDASRGLAKGSFDDEMIRTEPGIDDLKDLDDSERRALDEWVTHFSGKYQLVGELVEEL